MIQETFNSAQQHHQAGQLAEAQALYRQVLTEQPNHAAAMHFLGLTEFQLGRFDSALELMNRANQIDSTRADFYCNLGLVLATTGRLDAAVQAYERALKLKPDYAEAHNNLGIALVALDKIEKGIEEYRAAIRLRPNYPEAYNNLGSALHSLNQYDPAIEALQHALDLKPDFSEARNNLGNTLLDANQVEAALEAFSRALSSPQKLPQSFYGLGNALRKNNKLEDAIEAFRKAIEMSPTYGEAYNNLGETLLTAGDITGAVSAMGRAVELRPTNPTVLYNFANSLMHDSQYEQAKAMFHRALELKPDYPEAQTNLGNALFAQGHIDQGLAAHELNVKTSPEFALGHLNYALALLLTGDWDRGFAEYEWCWKVDAFKKNRPVFSQPRWDGSDLEGKRILLFNEQGFGDAIQFARYVPLVSKRGGKVIVQAPQPLQRLFEDAFGIENVVADPPPLFDVQSPFLNLPRAFRTTIQSIPADVPYLRSNATLIEYWRSRVPAEAKLLKVGLVWRGRATPDAQRSIPTELLAPLGDVPNLWFTNLQVGHSSPPPPFAVADWREELKDFADTAALMANLDLVLTIDSAAAHLAGALGRPTWTMLKYVPDWRWLREREDSPFYPTMRLFRQTTLGDWAGVLAKVATELHLLAEKRAAVRDDC
jgi:tetratricopeptide (TPR) repeat protein